MANLIAINGAVFCLNAGIVFLDSNANSVNAVNCWTEAFYTWIITRLKYRIVRNIMILTRVNIDASTAN